MFLQLLGVFAEFERRTLIERILAGLRVKASRGLWVGGPPPFGYCLVDKVLCAVPDEAIVVQRVFDEYLAGDGAKTIANRLNDQGHQTRKGSRWTAQAILGMLRRVTYVGRIRHRDDVHEGAHAAIIEPDVFEDVQTRLGANGGAPRTRESRTYLLAGTLRCGECGAAMTGAMAGGNGGTYRYYRCTAAAKDKGACQGVSVRADEIESQFIDEIVEVYKRVGFFEAALESVRANVPSVIDELSAELVATRKLAASDRQSIDRYLRSFEAGRFEIDEVQDRLSELSASRAARDAWCAELEAKIERVQSAAQPAPAMDTSAGMVERALRGPMDPATRLFVEAAVAAMTIDSDRNVKMTLRVPSPGTLVSKESSLVELGGIEPPSIRR